MRRPKCLSEFCDATSEVSASAVSIPVHASRGTRYGSFRSGAKQGSSSSSSVAFAHFIATRFIGPMKCVHTTANNLVLVQIGQIGQGGAA